MTTLAPEKQKELYRLMLMNRQVEERLVNLYRQGQVVGGLYRSLGQEATSVGSAFALEPGDLLAPLIRNLGATLVRGVSARDILTQYMARGTSPSRGKDANLHFSIPEKGIYAPISMLGTLIPVVAGMCLAERMKGKSTVGMTYIGDGGTSVGAFHEGLNFAAVQKLPFVLVVESNGWAYSTPTDRQCLAGTLADKALGYGIPGVVVDGNDVFAVYDVTKQAVERARAGGGPTLVECKTYRMKGHAEHDGQGYVSKEELARWREMDPIARCERQLETSGVLPEIERTRIQDELRTQLDGDVVFAESSPWPDPALALKGVWSDDALTTRHLEGIFAGGM